MQRYRNLFSVVLVIFAVTLHQSCQTAGINPSASPSADDPIAEADELYRAGLYSSALMKYSSYVYSPYPAKSRLPEARYRMGLCHYFLNQYSDAAETMRRLLDEEPNVAFAAEAKEILAKSEERMQEAQAASAELTRERLKKIYELEQSVSERQAASDYYALANLYWDNGEFERAVENYEAAIRLNREYESDGLIRKRVRITDDNKFVVRDPLLELQDQGPVRVKNTHLDVRERDNWLGSSKDLRLSGEVENVGLRDVRNVSVEVTLYDFFEKIQDTKTVRIGRLRAGDVRAFAVLLDRFSGSANGIHKYTTHVMYDE